MIINKVNIWRYFNPAATKIDLIFFKLIMSIFNDIFNIIIDKAKAAAANLNN